MPNWLRWFLTAIGLLKREQPTPTPTPEPPKPQPIPDTLPAPTFHGFLLRRGGHAMYREPTWLQVTPQVTGCGDEQRRFGIESNGSGPYEYKITVTHLDSNKQDRLYTETHDRVEGKWFNNWRVMWYPLAESFAPSIEQLAVDVKACGGGAAPLPPKPTPATVSKVRIDIWIRNSHGNESHWRQEVEVVGSGCDAQT